MGTQTMTILWRGVEIQVVATEDGDKICEWMQRQQEAFFGMDVECYSTTSKPALLKLCGDGGCLVLQLLHVEAIPAEFREFLQDKANSLCGVGIWQGKAKLARYHGLMCTRPLDLGIMASEMCKCHVLQQLNLQELADVVLGYSVKKPRYVTAVSCSQPQLTDCQIQYAALDAYVAYSTALKMRSMCQ